MKIYCCIENSKQSHKAFNLETITVCPHSDKPKEHYHKLWNCCDLLRLSAQKDAQGKDNSILYVCWINDILIVGYDKKDITI